MKMLVIAIACFAGLSACSDSPSHPTAPSPAVVASAGEPAARPPASRLYGFVVDTAFRAVPGALVEVVNGPHAGMAVTANASGEVWLAGSFDQATLFRASSEGHLAKVQPMSCSVSACPGATGASPWLGFYLDVPAPPANVAGEYRMTFTVDGTCRDWPAELRTRTYRATVTPRPGLARATTLDVVLSGAQFMGNLSGFTIGVAGDDLGFWLYGGHNPAIVELTESVSVSISGFASANATRTIAAQFNGWIEYSGGGEFSRCESANHQLVLAPDPR
jgi:hypothetical protein